jgi:predicted negative regulator of RcsB-dependent stress response
MEIKEQLKEDEKLLVKVFQLEKFVKKYKYHLIALVVLIVSLIVGKSIYNYTHTQMLIKTNKAFEKLMQNPNDKAALNILKENKPLYNLYLLTQNKKVNDPKLAAISAYKEALEKGDIKSLKNYLLNPNYDILKDSVRFNLMRLYLQKGDRKNALNLYKEISKDSDYYKLATFLIHYGIVK